MINNLLAAAWEWQWADFVIATIGSLLGFLFAILSAYGVNKLLERTRRKNIINRLVEELDSYSKNIEKKEAIIKKIESGKDINHRIISLPYLEQLFATNQILLLANQPYYTDLVELLNKMNDINHWYGIKADFYFENIIDVTPLKDGQWQHNNATKSYKALCNMIAEQVKESFYSQVTKMQTTIQKINNDN